ncbi:alanine racemase [Kushneria aurantia]|uniref:Alanine racemase n=1 Tax=Kushneria aurantia TaxID=504092 RepID=A0ABV6G580_9GAMM|nr:alanine racemase [Kushneria aurantia]
MSLPTPCWPTAYSVENFRHNLAAVHARIAAACARAGRDPAEVRLLPVSKTVPEAHIRLAYAAGCRELGENRLQEAQRKAAAMADLDDLRWSVIGHLQTNKARAVARFASEFQALDSLRQQAPAGITLQALSMGMSGDFELAIEEGATIVRVGQAIFGARATPNSVYWPDGDPTDNPSEHTA